MSRRIDRMEKRYGVNIEKQKGYNYKLIISIGFNETVIPNKRLYEIKEILKERFGF